MDAVGVANVLAKVQPETPPRNVVFVLVLYNIHYLAVRAKEAFYAAVLFFLVVLECENCETSLIRRAVRTEEVGFIYIQGPAYRT